jgi:16S rRNA (uracil1498-N3)-methyltransferase
MPADRFFFEGPLTPEIALSGDEFHHLKVVRIAIGEAFEIVNGKGSIANATLTRLDKRAANLSLTKIQTLQAKPARLILGIPFMRMNKLEWVIEKGTELGADAFYLYPAQFSEQLQLSNKQLERLYHIAISALKQSGRLFLPSFEVFASFHELFSNEGSTLYGEVRSEAVSLVKTPLQKTVLFISGPEKGFSSDENELLAKKAQGVSLSPHILRAETAPIAAISILSLLVEVPKLSQ